MCFRSVMMSRAAEKIDCERPTLSFSNKTHVWFSSDVPLTDVVDFYPFSLTVFQISPLDLSSTSNCSGCLDVTLYSEEISRLKREFEDIQRMILGQEQVS